MAQINQKTLDKFGVPTTGNTGSGILMPKLKLCSVEILVMAEIPLL